MKPLNRVNKAIRRTSPYYDWPGFFDLLNKREKMLNEEERLEGLDRKNRFIEELKTRTK